ncbi:MAG: carbohydrate porin [Proteobacteria bacterium]|nr:carbohydrate porin [Pseudomonadota bacterium]
MRTNLLAAMIAVSLFGAATAAHADPDPRTKHSSKRHVVKKKAAPAAVETAAPVASSSDRAEIDALKAQLAAMQEKLENLEERSDAQSEVNTQQAKTNEDVAKSTAKTDSLAKLVNDTSVSGTVFADTTSLAVKDHGVKNAASGYGFDVKRAYVSINHKFNDTYSANVTTDFQYASAISATEVYIKKAYVQGKYSDAFTVRLGSADLPWVPYAEGNYGYRYVENTLADRLKVGTSADWGLHVFGTFNNSMFNYAVSAVNGNGYKNTTRSKGVDLEARVGVTPIEGLNIAVGGYHGKLGKDVNGATNVAHSANRIDGLVAYSNKMFRVGVEYFSANNWNRVTTGAPNAPGTIGGYGLVVHNPTPPPAGVNTFVGDRARGWSLFGNVNFSDKASVFARYDNADVSRWLDPGLKDKYYNFGVDYALTKGVKVAAVYKHEELKDGAKTDAKGDEFGIFTEIKW